MTPAQYEVLQRLTADRHPGVRELVRWFDFRHLAAGAPRTVSMLCADFAGRMLGQTEIDNAELTAGLRKLLEAKDCFVRAAIAAQTGDAR